MNDIDSTLKEAYNATSTIVMPGSGSYGMEAVARQWATGKKVLVLRNGYFSYRWTDIFEQTGIPSEGGGRVQKLVVIVFSIAGFILNLILLGLIVETCRKLLDGWRSIYGKIIANIKTHNPVFMKSSTNPHLGVRLVS